MHVNSYVIRGEQCRLVDLGAQREPTVVSNPATCTIDCHSFESYVHWYQIGSIMIARKNRQRHVSTYLPVTAYHQSHMAIHRHN